MEGTLTPPCRVSEKVFGLYSSFVCEDEDSSIRRSTGKLRASSSGNTKGASGVRNYWAERVCRRLNKIAVKWRGSTSELQL